MIKIVVAVIIFGLLIAFTIQKQEGVLENGRSSNQLDEPAVTQSDEPKINSNAVLDLNGQALRETPSYVFEKTDIQKLILSNNNLGGSLQAEVRHLQNLKVLDLSNNRFTGVPAEIGQLKNLEVLDLSNNQITGLPYELGNLSNLKLLNLRGNNYSQSDLEIIKKTLPVTTEILTN